MAEVAPCLRIVPLEPTDVDALTAVMTRASDDDVQRRGIGAALFRHVEAAIPARSWTLETPGFAVSNHRPYAGRCGFRKVREHDDPDGIGSVFVFEKSD